MIAGRTSSWAWPLTAALAATLVLSPAAAFCAGSLSLVVHAGIGGLVKSDRWVPVQVRLHDAGADAAGAPGERGDLVVSWGDVTLTRPVSLGSTGDRTFELYVRASEPRDVLRVSLESAGRRLASADVAVRVLEQTEEVTLCVQPALPTDIVADTAACSAILTPEKLPRSPRGYEVVDRVSLAADASALSAEQRDALRAREMIQQLDRSGDLSLVAQPARPILARGLVPETAQLAGMVLGLYALALCAFGLLTRRWRIRPRDAFAVVVLTAIAGSGVVMAIGRVGPGQAIQWHHSSLLQQIPGTEMSLFTTRATAVFPARDAYALELSVTDGALQTLASERRTTYRESEDGMPVLAGPWALAGREGLAAEGVVHAQPLAVQVTGTEVVVSNTLSQPLDNCRFGNGYERRDVGRLNPGAAVTRPLSPATPMAPGPLLTCTMRDLPVTIRETRRPIDARGVTAVVAYAPPPPASLDGAP